MISLDGRYLTAATGATAVALLAELQYQQATGDDRFGLLRSAWLKGLLSLRIPGRGFRVSPTLIDDTPFYDGEAWFALAYYNERFPQDDGIARLLESLDAYLRSQKELKAGKVDSGNVSEPAPRAVREAENTMRDGTRARLSAVQPSLNAGAQAGR